MSRLESRLAKLEGPNPEENTAVVAWVPNDGHEIDEAALRSGAEKLYGPRKNPPMIFQSDKITEPQFEFIQDMAAVLDNVSKNSARIGNGFRGNR